MSYLALARLLLSLAPSLRTALVALIKALQSGDEAKAFEAYEAARRVAFIARQKR
jgi:hypothetical protein